MLDLDDGFDKALDVGDRFESSAGRGFGGGVQSLFSRRGGRVAAPPKKKVPVSILTGFLGAGKTTLVQHILRNREGLKVGVVVNDVAEANIDSEVLKLEDADGVIGLQNGCVCCSGRQDLFTRLKELAESDGVAKLDKPWDRFVVECSGVAEPENIAKELESMAQRKEAIMQRIFLAGIICVVDASTFWTSYNSSSSSSTEAMSIDRADADNSVSDKGETKPLSSLLTTQLESADTVVINKVDLVGSTELEGLSNLIGMLCPNAKLLNSQRGAVPLRTLLPADPVDLDMPGYVPTLAIRHGVAVHHAESHHQSDGESHGHEHDHGHSHSHGHTHSSEEGGGSNCAICDPKLLAEFPIAAQHMSYGLESFVYRRTKLLFLPSKLASLVQQMPVDGLSLEFLQGAGDIALQRETDSSPAFHGLLRSKGFMWLSKEQGGSDCYYWSHAGRRVEVTSYSSSASGVVAQELVFIGIQLQRNLIEAAFDACLVEPSS